LELQSAMGQAASDLEALEQEYEALIAEYEQLFS